MERAPTHVREGIFSRLCHPGRQSCREQKILLCINCFPNGPHRNSRSIRRPFARTITIRRSSPRKRRAVGPAMVGRHRDRGGAVHHLTAARGNAGCSAGPATRTMRQTIRRNATSSRTPMAAMKGSWLMMSCPSDSGWKHFPHLVIPRRMR